MRGRQEHHLWPSRRLRRVGRLRRHFSLAAGGICCVNETHQVDRNEDDDDDDNNQTGEVVELVDCIVLTGGDDDGGGDDYDDEAVIVGISSLSVCLECRLTVARATDSA